MARRKGGETEKALYAVMRSGKLVQSVKVWQYYSVFGFCRGFGETREKADTVARWCMNKAKPGDVLNTDKYSITIEEREVAV